MIHTKPEEIITVKKNLPLLEDHISQSLKKKLLTQMVRSEQHPLFYSLCNPSVFPYLETALNSIKTTYKGKYFSKAVSKLVKNAQHIHHQAAVYEIIAVGYYLSRYSKSKKIQVEWERVVSKNKKTVDISLIGLDLPINIEVTAKDQDERINQFTALRYKVKEEIEKNLQNISEHKYSYFFSIPTKNAPDEGMLSYFSEKDIPAFINFFKETRKKGVGNYTFSKKNIKLATLEIAKLNKYRKEYAAHLDMWTGFLQDNRKIKDKVLKKAKEQLPKNEINFIFVPNIGGFDDIDYQEAFFGQEQWIVNSHKNITDMTRKPNGIVSIIQEENLSPVHGLIYSKWDFQKGKLLINPLVAVPKKYWSMVVPT